MSHSNGRVYVEQVGDVTYGVSFDDVRKVLNDNSTDEKGLCQSGKINKWARYKPVRYAGFPLRFKGNEAFDKVTGLNFGQMIDFPSSVACYSDPGISYEKPSGGMSSPYRITDFNKYNHYAEKPFVISWGTEFRADRAKTCTVGIYDRSSDADALGITFSDILNEISASSGFRNRDKRLCLAVFGEVNGEIDDSNPLWYFFSESFSTVGSSGSWQVSTRTDNSIFANKTGEMFKFVVMLVSDHDDLNDIVEGTDRYVWQYGVSPEKMTEMESGNNPIMAMYLSFEEMKASFSGSSEQMLEAAHVISNLSYFIDIISADKYGSNVQSGAYNILCTQLQLPAVIVKSPGQMNASAQYQMRVRFSQGNTSFGIFRPTDKVGDDYYGADFTNAATSLAEMPVTQWIRVDDLTDAPVVSGGVWEYEFDFYNFQHTILSRSAAQTQNESSGLFLFFDEDTSSGNSFDIVFSLYYKESPTSQEIKVRDFSVAYNALEGTGFVHDIEI